MTKLSYVRGRIEDTVPERFKSEIRDVLREVNAENKKHCFEILTSSLDWTLS
ncbi:18092_t:CDS:2 [Rhizophagus irregularis]|nr:18092_t:CDS:2 [Rhizophagus irregularis]